MSVSSKNILLGGAATAEVPDVSQVFKTFLYTGDSSNQNVQNSINLSDNHGLVMLHRRDSSTPVCMLDSRSGSNVGILGNGSALAVGADGGDSLTAFNSNGFTIKGGSEYSSNGAGYCSWTFREANNFFTVKTVSHSNGSSSTIDLSSLGTVGMVIAKRNDTGNGNTGSKMFCVHRSMASGVNTNLHDARGTSAFTSNAHLSISGTNAVLASGADSGTYVIYGFAHATGDEAMIHCGNYTGTGSANITVTTGFEPQWIFVFRADTSGGSDKSIIDTIRGWHIGYDGDGSESGYDDVFTEFNVGGSDNTSSKVFDHLQTGFKVASTNDQFNANGGTYVFVAIRSEMMVAPETSSAVFNILRNSQSVSFNASGLNRVDSYIILNAGNGTGGTGGADRISWFNRITTSKKRLRLDSRLAAADYDASNNVGGFDIAPMGSYGVYQANHLEVRYFFKNARNFFQVVGYKGDSAGTSRTVNHSLGVAPEAVVIKKKSGGSSDWFLLHANQEGYFAADSSGFGSRTNSFTSTTFTTGSDSNGASDAYSAWLFATLPGVSKVGTYTCGSGAKDVDCGFTSGAKFVYIKRFSSSSGKPHIFNSVSGIVAGNDTFATIETTSAEENDEDLIDPLSSGFSVPASGNADIHSNGETYFFIAVAA